MNGATDKRSWLRGAGYEPTRVFNETDGAWRGASRQRARRDERRRRTRPAAWLALVAGATAVGLGGSFVVRGQTADPPAERPLTDVVREAVDAMKIVASGTGTNAAAAEFRTISPTFRDFIMASRQAIVRTPSGRPADRENARAVRDGILAKLRESSDDPAAVDLVVEAASLSYEIEDYATARLLYEPLLARIDLLKTPRAAHVADFVLKVARAEAESELGCRAIDAVVAVFPRAVELGVWKNEWKEEGIALGGTVVRAPLEKARLFVLEYDRRARDDQAPAALLARALDYYEAYLRSPYPAHPRAFIPSGRDVLREMAFVHLRLGDVDAALQTWRRMPDWPPRVAENTLESMGGTLLDIAERVVCGEEQTDSVIEQSLRDKAVARKYLDFVRPHMGFVPESDQFYWGLRQNVAILANLLGDFQTVIEALEPVVFPASFPSDRYARSDPKPFATALELLGSAYYERGRLAEARSVFTALKYEFFVAGVGEVADSALKAIDLRERARAADSSAAAPGRKSARHRNGPSTARSTEE